MTGERATDRTVFEISGSDRTKFLQDLVTNDLGGLDNGLVYAALLSPQGKYLADFFLVPQDDAILLDVKTPLAQALGQRLTMYKLRADVTIAPTDLNVLRGLGPTPDDAFADPRHPALGWRQYTTAEGDPATVDWDEIRVAHQIPETGIELMANETYILEAGFEALSGVDFKKGCYVGQEVTARMKHKTELRKGLTTVLLDAPVESGTDITANGRAIGTVFTQSGDKAIAYLRFDRVAPEMSAGAATVRLP